MRNRQAIVHWLLANTPHRRPPPQREDLLRRVEPYDVPRRRRRMLAEVQRIKSEGDYAAAKELFETYGVHFDPEMRDEVVARVEHLHLPSYTGFVMPKLTPVRDAAGAITDVEISYCCNFAEQMLESGQV